VRVLVNRKAGDKLAPEIIVDILCNVQAVGIDRGKQYLYDEGMNKRVYEISLPYRKQIYPADVIVVHNGSVGESFVGRITAHTINITQSDGAITVDSLITVERSEEV
jgi:hypothetical protein